MRPVRPPTMTREIRPGLLVLHGNRLELLAEAVFDWLGRTPLAPLEQELLLVPSNGAAEWLKMALARRTGLCAATRVELPARFLWRLYRQVLGHSAVPSRSALDKDALTWRLMRLLPALRQRPGFEPVAGYLQGDAPERRLQLARRLADLFDQYQVYRADWLAAWQAGQDSLIGADGQPRPLPADQQWQALLWRAVLAELDSAELASIRPRVHQAAVAALTGLGPSQLPAGLPRRVLLFGAAHLPGQALDALAALSRHAQVLLAVPNPCRFHWADILEGRELLRAAPPRQRARAGLPLADLPLADMHQHAHPLLAAWGRQGRDFMRQLDAFDDVARSRLAFDMPRVDLFDEGPGQGLLGCLQAAVRDLLPLAEHPRQPADPADRSIVFHLAHSAQREVEVLHDQLLAVLAAPPGGTPLAPRDIVVMVPDIETFAPAIRAVFGQPGRDDARHIPFDIADLPGRASQPLVQALAWLLEAPARRFAASELRDLLDVPALAQRFGLEADQLPGLARWIDGAGARWGLHAGQRATLGLGAAGEQNTWHFALQRMLLGFASGPGPAFAGITPYDEIGGLEAGSVGALARLLQVLGDWWALSQRPAPPQVWAARGRALLADAFAPTDERDRLALASLQAALGQWLESCDAAGFDAAVPLPVLREAWLAGLDSAASGGGRFLAGGVTFCTLMPLRAIPFEVVCLLGMNDGDYPRQTPRSDFDLMGLPGQPRPGDRSRRDDDRYLMLEAVLSARQLLYVSWAGRSVRDNSEQPPSVLVAQLRDYLVAAWPPSGPGQPADEVLRQRTTVHPLQPFSRRYFEGGALFTHAREWRAAHADGPSGAGPAQPASPAALPPFDAADVALSLDTLVRFLRQPVKAFFRTRLDVVFDEAAEPIDDDEPFGLGGLDRHALLDGLLSDAAQVLVGGPLAADAANAADAALRASLARAQGAGRLPLGPLGPLAAAALLQAGQATLQAWCQALQDLPQTLPPLPVRLAHAGLTLADWLSGLRSAAAVMEVPAPPSSPSSTFPAPPSPATTSSAPVWLSRTASQLLLARPGASDATRATAADAASRDHGPPPAVRPERLIEAWVRGLVASALGTEVEAWVVGSDAVVRIAAPPRSQALAHLQALIEAWQAGMDAPLPVAARTALTWAARPDAAAQAYDGGYRSSGEVTDPCLARLFPDFEALTADGQFPLWAERLYAPLQAWVASQAHVTPHPLAEAADADTGADALPEQAADV